MNGKATPWVLGVNLSPHHGSMCLLKGDEIVVAIPEERLNRQKKAPLRVPEPLALNYCLEYAGISKNDLDLVVGCGVVSQKLIAECLKAMFPNTPVLTINHHLSHAVGAFATSGFSEAAILVVDGGGSYGDDLAANELAVAKHSPVPDNCQTNEIISLYGASNTEIINLEKHVGGWLIPGNYGMEGFRSLGAMFSAAAQLIFRDWADAGKVMGLAPYGQPKIPRSEFFDIVDGRFVFSDKVTQRFPFSEPWPAHQSEYQTLAASVQAALEEALEYLVRYLKELCPSENLIFTGGVALNSVANDKILVRGGEFKNVYIMPPAEDSGNAIGAAYYGVWQLTKKNTKRQLVHDALGRAYKLSEIDAAIAKTPAVKVCESEKAIGFAGALRAIATAADLLTEGKIIGWFQGRSELGPRALGQRSIICDPRRLDGKEYLNNRVKHREGFRPFAPVILLEEANNWFELDGVEPDCPFMLRVCRFRDDKKSLVPAVVHVDGTGRVQTVTKERNGKFYDLVRAFFELTGVPIILNTSFNVMGEPIVETPEDALWCLLYTGVDYCLLEERLVTKVDKYNSILDLYPYITTLDYQMTPTIKDKFSLGYTLLDADYYSSNILFSVSNKWGDFEVSGDVKWLSLLKHVDGKKTGWDLWENLNKEEWNLDELSFIRLLGQLRRLSILNFRSFPNSTILSGIQS